MPIYPSCTFVSLVVKYFFIKKWGTRFAGSPKLHDGAQDSSCLPSHKSEADLDAIRKATRREPRRANLRA